MEQKRPLGQILVDGDFLSNDDLNLALEEQKRTHELLGQVLVRRRKLKEGDVKFPLRIQNHLGRMEDAVRIAAGKRSMLGALLVDSKRITGAQLDHAIAEQKRTGEKLGEVFIRLGMLTELQLTGFLTFQHNQDTATDSPLRLGELLVAAGDISCEQLDDALRKQTVSRKKLGEVLVEEGYISAGRVRYGIRLQKMLLQSVLAAILSLGMGTTGYAASVQLQWDPNSETDLAGYKVYYGEESGYLEGGTPLDVQNQTVATISGLDPDKSYKFAVTAYNDAGVESSYSNIVRVVEQSPPVVAIASPAGGTSVSGVVNIGVNASDNVGVTRVEYYVNGQLKGTETTAPYVYSWDTANLPLGGYTLTAKAYDAAGNVGQYSSSVTVVKDTVAPVVTVTAPLNNAVVSGTVSINAGAGDNVGVSMVEIYCNGALLFAGNAPPYRFDWDTRSLVNGSYSLTARAYDSAKNISNSSSVMVTVNNPLQAGSGYTISDAMLALQVAVGKVKPTDEQKARLDVAPVIEGKPVPDKKVNTADAIVILSKVVGKME
jgi:hypothetical protein